MIRLRKLEPTDLPFLYQWENDSSAWADGTNHNPLSQQDMRDYIRHTTGDIYKDGQLRLMIEAEEETVGCVDLFDFDPRNRRAAIGMYVMPENRGKGYAKVALEMLETYAFGYLNLRILYAIIAMDNEPCTSLYKQAGYTSSSPLLGWTLEFDAVIWIKHASASHHM